MGEYAEIVELDMTMTKGMDEGFLKNRRDPIVKAVENKQTFK